MLGVGLSLATEGMRPNDLGWTVTLRPIDRLAVNLNQHGIVHVRPEPRFNGFQIGLMTVRRYLNPVCQSARRVADKPRGAVRIPAPDQPTRDQFGIGADCRPRPDIASCTLFALWDVLLLGIYEAPYLIDLHTFARQIAEHSILIPGTGPPQIDQELGHCIDAGPRQPRSRTMCEWDAAWG